MTVYHAGEFWVEEETLSDGSKVYSVHTSAVYPYLVVDCHNDAAARVLANALHMATVSIDTGN